MRRTLSTVAATLAWLVALAVPAAAHSVSGVSATNFKTSITSIEPSVAGVSIEVIEAGSRLEVSNDTDTELTVLGYQDEPYLRLSRKGVFENRRSPAVYLNAVRKGTATVPGTADASADPQWVKVSNGHVARWHDHRAHWMGDQDPPQVRRQPGERHLISTFEIPLRYGEDRTVTVAGTLEWVPGPSAAPWWLLTAGLVVATAALVLVAARGQWGVALALLLAVLVVVDAVHAVGVALAAAGSLGSQIGKLAGGSFASFVAWGVAIAGIPFLLRRNDDGLWFAGFAALFMAIVGGLSDVDDLGRSQVPFAWSAGLARALVAVTLGLGFGIAAASAMRLFRGRPSLSVTRSVHAPTE